jgi:hypothetical protein
MFSTEIRYTARSYLEKEIKILGAFLEGDNKIKWVGDVRMQVGKVLRGDLRETSYVRETPVLQMEWMRHLTEVDALVTLSLLHKMDDSRYAAFDTRRGIIIKGAADDSFIYFPAGWGIMFDDLQSRRDRIRMSSVLDVPVFTCENEGSLVINEISDEFKYRIRGIDIDDVIRQSIRSMELKVAVKSNTQELLKEATAELRRVMLAPRKSVLGDAMSILTRPDSEGPYSHIPNYFEMDRTSSREQLKDENLSEEDRSKKAEQDICADGMIMDSVPESQGNAAMMPASNEYDYKYPCGDCISKFRSSRGQVAVYKVGPSHEPVFSATAALWGKFGTGRASKKKTAVNMAIENAICSHRFDVVERSIRLYASRLDDIREISPYELRRRFIETFDSDNKNLHYSENECSPSAIKGNRRFFRNNNGMFMSLLKMFVFNKVSDSYGGQCAMVEDGDVALEPEMDICVEPQSGGAGPSLEGNTKFKDDNLCVVGRSYADAQTGRDQGCLSGELLLTPRLLSYRTSAEKKAKVLDFILRSDMLRVRAQEMCKFVKALYGFDTKREGHQKLSRMVESGFLICFYIGKEKFYSPGG